MHARGTAGLSSMLLRIACTRRCQLRLGGPAPHPCARRLLPHSKWYFAPSLAPPGHGMPRTWPGHHHISRVLAQQQCVHR